MGKWKYTRSFRAGWVTASGMVIRPCRPAIKIRNTVKTIVVDWGKDSGKESAAVTVPITPKKRDE